MSPRFVACPKCRAPVPPALYNAGELRPCPSCRSALQIEVYAAALRPPGPGVAGETLVVDGEASCFYHPAKRAVVPCENCGRFLCAICDVELNGAHLCPGCIESGKNKGKIEKLENKRTLYDSLALAVALYPMLLAWVTIVTAPIALYIAIRYWSAPSSVVPRTRWRSITAIVIALLQIGGWALVIFAAMKSSHHH